MDTSLAATTAARKERLIALRKRKQAAESGGPNGPNGSANDINGAGPSHFTFKQRNFDPSTRQSRLRDRNSLEPDTVERNVQGLVQGILKEDEEKRGEDLDLFNIQPKRANWDLKRDMGNRMAKVERRTNEAIAGIFRQRLQAMREKGEAGAAEVDLVASMNVNQQERDEAGGDEVAEDSDDE